MRVNLEDSKDMTEGQRTRVLVVDDQATIRSGVVGLLEGTDGVKVVGEAANGAEAVEVAVEQRPDVVLMDVRMPVMDGVEATQRLLALCPDAAVLIHSASRDESLVIEALEAGARGYVLKGSSPSDLVAALDSVAAGHSHMSDEVTGPLVDKLVQARTMRRQTPPAAEEATERIANDRQRQRRFAMMSSHELRTPLTLMLGTLEFLMERESLAEDHGCMELLGSALRGAHRLRRLAENLEVAAFADSLEVGEETVDVRSILSPLIDDLNDDRRIIRSDVPPDLVALADRPRLVQLVDNLLRNAVAVTPTGGCVDVIARQAGGRVVIEIRDQGPGLERGDPDSDVVRSPEQFNLRPDAARGLGLGLWVAHQLVTLMGGELLLGNNSDAGATVTVTLPAHTAHLRAAC